MVYTIMIVACLVCSHSLLPILASMPLYASVAVGLLRIVRQASSSPSDVCGDSSLNGALTFAH